MKIFFDYIDKHPDVFFYGSYSNKMPDDVANEIKLRNPETYDVQKGYNFFYFSIQS
jgi:hypothetical protein